MDIKDFKNKIGFGLTQPQLAKQYNCSKSTIRYWLKKYSLKTKCAENGRRTWTDKQLIVALKNSTSIRQVILKLGLSCRPGNYITIKNRIKKLNLDTKHITGSAHGTGGKRASVEDMLKEHSPYLRKNIKRKIIKNKLIPYECALCKNKGTWKNNPLILILDHSNGVNDDYRIKNLRFLCPNCNSQQSTFCGKGKKKHRYICPQCGNLKTKFSGGICLTCKGVNNHGQEKLSTPD